MNIHHCLSQIDFNLSGQLVLNAVIEFRDLNSIVVFGEVYVLEDLSSDSIDSPQNRNNLLIVVAVCVLELTKLKVSCHFMCHGVILVGLDFVFEVEGGNH